MRGDAQAPERRGGTPGTRGPGPTPSSRRAGGGLDQSGAYARTWRCLPLGDRQAVRARAHAHGELSEGRPAPIGMQQSAEGIRGAWARAEGPNGGSEAMPWDSRWSGPSRSGGGKRRLEHQDGARRVARRA